MSWDTKIQKVLERIDKLMLSLEAQEVRNFANVTGLKKIWGLL